MDMKKTLFCLAVVCLAILSCEREKSYKYTVETTSGSNFSINLKEYDEFDNVLFTRLIYFDKENHSQQFSSMMEAVSIGIPPQSKKIGGNNIDIGNDERYKLRKDGKLKLTISSSGTIRAN